MKYGLVLNVFALLMFSAPGLALAEQWWRHVGTIGMRQFVMVSPSVVNNAKQLKLAANSVCTPSQACVVVFWLEDRSQSKSAKKLTLTQRRTIVAQYVRNPFTSIEQLQMKCQGHAQTGSKCL